MTFDVKTLQLGISYCQGLTIHKDQLIIFPSSDHTIYYGYIPLSTPSGPIDPTLGKLALTLPDISSRLEFCPWTMDGLFAIMEVVPDSAWPFGYTRGLYSIRPLPVDDNSKPSDSECLSLVTSCEFTREFDDRTDTVVARSPEHTNLVFCTSAADGRAVVRLITFDTSSSVGVDRELVLSDIDLELLAKSLAVHTWSTYRRYHFDFALGILYVLLSRDGETTIHVVQF